MKTMIHDKTTKLLWIRKEHLKDTAGWRLPIIKEAKALWGGYFKKYESIFKISNFRIHVSDFTVGQKFYLDSDPKISVRSEEVESHNVVDFNTGKDMWDGLVYGGKQYGYAEKPITFMVKEYKRNITFRMKGKV